MWKKPSDELPDCYVGDRVIGIVHYREHSRDALRPHVVILLALEDGGWWDVEDGGYSIEDCEWWILEKDLVVEVR